MNDFDYAGDLSPQEAWEMLKSKKECNLLDCRTFAEWQFVGIPDLSEINKKALFIDSIVKAFFTVYFIIFSNYFRWPIKKSMF